MDMLDHDMNSVPMDINANGNDELTVISLAYSKYPGFSSPHMHFKSDDSTEEFKVRLKMELLKNCKKQ